MNVENVERCVQCAQDRFEQRILCGSCGKSTSIPKSGVLDSLRSGIVDLEVELQRSWLDLTGQPYVACPKCQHAVKLPSQLTTASVKCNNCSQSFQAAPSAVSTDSGDNRRYVSLSPLSTQTAQKPVPNAGDLNLNDALSKIDETTSQFANAPTVNNPASDPTDLTTTEQPQGRIIYQPTEKKETEVDLVNSFANTS